jgi:hypothetical protein
VLGDTKEILPYGIPGIASVCTYVRIRYGSAYDSRHRSESVRPLVGTIVSQ